MEFFERLLTIVQFICYTGVVYGAVTSVLNFNTVVSYGFSKGLVVLILSASVLYIL